MYVETLINQAKTLSQYTWSTGKDSGPWTKEHEEGKVESTQ